jgi:molecular chaperone Hsp33
MAARMRPLMIDRLVRGLFPSRGLRALFVRVGDTARMVRVLHGLTPTTARLFAELLAGGALVGALQKEARGRVNLQLEGDGPVRGLFVDADPDGNVRGYVRAPGVDLPGEPAAAARAALGRSGYLSVIRDLGEGRFYRSAVALGGDDVAGVLRRWFAVSEQVETALDLCVVPRAEEPLGDVVGLLVQRLPDGDAAAVAALRQALAEGALARALAGGAGAPGHGGAAQDVLAAVAGPGFELLADQEVAYRCGCSLARARAAVSALGADGVAEVLASEGRAEVSCEFCHAHYVLDREALQALLARLREGGAPA